MRFAILVTQNGVLLGAGASSSTFGKVLGVALIALAFMGCTAAPEDTNTAGTGLPVAGAMAGMAAGNAMAGVGGAAGVAGTTDVGGAAGVGGASGAAGTAGVGGASGAAGTEAGAAGTEAGAAGTEAGAAGTEAGAAGTEAGTGGDDGHVPLCISDFKQVVLIGDSYVDWASHTFPADLAGLAGATGIWNRPPSAGTMYAVGGTALLTGQIPMQLTNACSALEVRTVIMDGGGNDVLLNLGAQQCKATGSSTDAVCQQIVADTLEVSKQMMDAMVVEGISDVVYFFYPHAPLNTLLGGPNPNEILDYSLPLARESCEDTLERTNGALKCHFVDLVPVFEGHADWFAAGDLHPNPTGSAAMADAVWTTMVDNCVGQPASSGCCREP